MVRRIKKRKEQDNTPGIAGKVEDNPEQGHSSDQTADLGGIDQSTPVDKKAGETPEGAETAETMYEQMEGDDYLEAILAKLEELERRLSDLEGVGAEQMEDEPEFGMEPEPEMEVAPEIDEYEEQLDEDEITATDEVEMEEKLAKFSKRKRIEKKAKKLFVPKRRVEKRMTTRISTIPIGHSANKKANLREFLGEVKQDQGRI